MPVLSLLRHAKSAWVDGVADRQRSLSPRGQQAAPLMGQYISRENLTPDLILCSPAIRTRQTLELLLPELPHQPEITFEETLYTGGVIELFTLLRAVPTSTRHALVLGHNPTMEYLASKLSTTFEQAHMDRMKDKFPTAGLAVIEFKSADWANIDQSPGHLRRFITPKQATKS